jgi:hypothetical protein
VASLGSFMFLMFRRDIQIAREADQEQPQPDNNRRNG